MHKLFGFSLSDHSRVFAIALPMIISNIAAPLLGLVDTAIIGHLPDAIYLSAVAVGAMVVSFIYLLAVFLRMATTGYIAQSYGADDIHAQRQHFNNGIIIALGLGVLIAVASPLINDLAMWVIAPSAELEGYARDYIEIRLWSAPASLITLVALGVLLGRQNSRKAMLLVIITNAVNVVMDVILILGFGLNVKGAAWASLSAEWVTAIVGFYWTARALGWHLRHWQLKFQQLRQFLGVNGNIFIRSLVLQLCMATMTGYATRYGSTMVAVNAVLMQFLMLISLGLDGIAYAVEALAGAAKGQKRYDKVRYWCKITLLWSSLFAVVYTLVFALAGSAIIRLITDIPEIIRVAEDYLPWIIVLPLLAHWSYWFDGVFIGLSLSRGMRNTMILSAVIGFLPLWWAGLPLENHGLWLALSGFLFMRGITQAIWFKYLSSPDHPSG
ncbi:MAG TPA: MATE family efflux transporter [Idiomarina abyssalis]|uniref:MATE family efflux transporter n=1 Tax=Idiomarina TaxID=135575 RepID=UPI000C5EA952|nr:MULTISPECIES: MATE family efflux transporter [Idiomarina]MAB21366.1 MATE family efflux transporter [Idiomarina sp.]MBH93516.1 MATE family efflux transporter [Idiomarina sp.]HAS15567.1 MATE family efflux transporter [Idiomarina abyssalis]|tara:strand:+ start:65133 stop:66455 length:1323 start_codon:yes stop_codon:yes gene_type:complete